MHRTLYVAALALATAGLSACSATPPSTATAAPVAQKETGFQQFRCTDGSDLALRFLTERGVALLQRQGQMLELPQQPVASGFFYSNGRVGVRGQGQEIRLELGRMAPIHCQAL